MDFENGTDLIDLRDPNLTASNIADYLEEVAGVGTVLTYGDLTMTIHDAFGLTAEDFRFVQDVG